MTSRAVFLGCEGMELALGVIQKRGNREHDKSRNARVVVRLRCPHDNDNAVTRHETLDPFRLLGLDTPCATGEATSSERMIRAPTSVARPQDLEIFQRRVRVGAQDSQGTGCAQYLAWSRMLWLEGKTGGEGVAAEMRTGTTSEVTRGDPGRACICRPYGPSKVFFAAPLVVVALRTHTYQPALALRMRHEHSPENMSKLPVRVPAGTCLERVRGRKQILNNIATGSKFALN
ncbi:hypothetical protein K438DRAFT_1776576 [Mycena galopus ATCC 62051]|nr:hypothetical protein K438DRAFT_1776576 [Mycena galopus ATCC 62051]